MPRTISLTLAALCALAVATPALAQPLPNRDDTYRGTATDQSFGGVNNLEAQARGCVKLCARDMNPCDPPVFKQADGRCNFDD